MNRVFDASQKVPILVWADRVDRLSLQCLTRLARWDRFAGPIAVMPDIHFSDEVCVGTVLATESCVLPTAIGQDLGCGMRTARFDFGADQFSHADFERIIAALQQRVPCGRRMHAKPQALPDALLSTPLSAKSLAHARDFLGARQLGTLGEGNHFIELQRGSEERLYATVHSGSRGMGAAIARHHAAVVARGKSCGDPLPWLELGTREADDFLADLNWAQAFAAENRARMMDDVRCVLEAHSGRAVAAELLFDVAHNLISMEAFGGRLLAIHRKGAMPAGAGARGIVPGSMGTASYLVEGLGNPASYASCSHGAGRKLSRAEAHRKITIKDLRRQMAGVAYPSDAEMERALVEEAPGAYKDIRDVIERQRDLIVPRMRLTPLAALKG